METSAQLVSAIKQKASLVDYVSKHIKLQKKGDSYLGLCPFHHEKSPSFTVNDKKGFYYCFGCHASGDIFSFLQEINKQNFPDVLKTLANDLGLDLPTSNFNQGLLRQQNALKLFVEHAHKNLFSNVKVLEYLHSRGVNEESMKQYLLGYVDATCLQQVDKEFAQTLGLTRVINNRILFPIFNKSNVVGYGARCLEDDNKTAKYINSPDSALFEKRKLLYGMDKKSTIALTTALPKTLLVEGYLDAILINQNTSYQAWASLGTAISHYQLELLWNKENRPIICLDGDSAGVQSTKRCCVLALEYVKDGKNLDVCLLNKDQDPANMALFHKDELETMIENSIPLSQFLFNQACGDKNMNSQNIIAQNPSDKNPNSSNSSEITEQTLLECKKELQEHLNKIKDKTVRQVFKTQWGIGFKNLLLKIQPAKKQTKVPRAKGKQSELMLLCLLIKFPDLLDEVCEQFALIEYDSSLQGVQQNILNKAEPTAQMQKLVQMTSLPNNIDLAKKYWIEIYDLLIKQHYKEEMAKLQQLFEKDFDQKVWDRIVEIQKLLTEQTVIE